MTAMPVDLPLDLPADAPAAPAGLLLAYSGGLDSSVLLHRLAAEPRWRQTGLRAVHVHHGLQPGADAWAAHCGATCAALGVPLEVVRVQVAAATGLGLEAAARQARYAALEERLAPGEWLLTAHHLDDQAETFLLRALRASGPEGLAAMRPLRRFGPGWHWRPLLDCPRAALLDWARARGLDWIEDPSNAQPDPERNFLRLEVLPLLRRRWPQAAAALARSAALSAEANTLLESADQALLAPMLEPGGQVLALPPLLDQPAARRARLLRLWVRGLGLPPLPARGVEAIEGQLLHARGDAQPCFAWAGARLLRWRGRLHADWQRAPLPAGWSCSWDGRAPLELPDGGRLQLCDAGGRAAPAGFAEPLRVAARQGGERLRMPGRAHRHALKHLLQDAGIPPWERAGLPLLWHGSADAAELLAAGDRIVAAPLQSWLQARGLRLHWQPPRGRPGAR